MAAQEPPHSFPSHGPTVAHAWRGRLARDAGGDRVSGVLPGFENFPAVVV
jgi:hypothetical protein